MHRTIIAVCGKPNVGKTTTVRLVYDHLSHENEIIDEGRGWKEVRGAVLEIDGVRVGFASRGDCPGDLEETLDLLSDADCGVILCATRPSPLGSYWAVKRREADYNLVWVNKRAAHNFDRANQKTADEIIGRVREAIEVAQPLRA